MDDITCQQGQQRLNRRLNRSFNNMMCYFPVSRNIVLEGWRGNRIKEVKGSAIAVDRIG